MILCFTGRSIWLKPAALSDRKALWFRYACSPPESLCHPPQVQAEYSFACKVPLYRPCRPPQVQAEDRAHRIGQSRSVNIYLLHARGSIDDVIWTALQDKLEHVGQVPG